jgi:tetratricopeptide (TPR) repeat protein
MARTRKLFGFLRRKEREPTPRSEGQDADLERFFTDAIEARDRFQQLVASERLPKRIVAVFGVGAVGKSSLLRIYRLYCRREGVPAGLVGGEEAPSAVDVLARWGGDLADNGLDLPRFRDSIEHYREIQAKVDQEARLAGQAEADAAQKLGEVAVKASLKVLATAVPGGQIIEAVGGEAAAALLNLLRAKLSKPDFDLYIDPVARLTDDFLTDLTRLTEQRRIVVMLDTFEQVAIISKWLAETVQRFPENVLTVVAGRELPDWDRYWPGWVGRAELIELREMSDADMETLVRLSYRMYERGEPGAEQIQSIVRFARGLPMAATTIVRLSVIYGIEDLSPVDPRAIADLADRLLEGVPQETRPAFEAAAILRYFQSDSLGALVDGADGQSTAKLYDELRRWPFVRSRRGGLAVHETMRDVINDALQTRSPQRFRDLHRKAAAYYQSELGLATGEEREHIRLEWLYHAIRADEIRGIQSFQEMAEELARYQLVGRLRTLITDADTYPLADENSKLWRRYYRGRLEHLQGRTESAEQVYREIGDDGRAEPKLRAYALCDLGSILDDLDRLSEPDGERRAEEVVERSLQLLPDLDAKLASNHVTLMNISNARTDWEGSLEHLGALRGFVERAKDTYELVMVDRLEAAIHALRGDWRGYLTTRERYVAAVGRLGDVPALRMHVSYFTWPLVFMGRCREAQHSSEQAVEIANQLEERELMVTILESVALALGMQDRFAEARERFDEAMNFFENLYGRPGDQVGRSNERYIRATLSFRGLVSLREGRLDSAETDLQRGLDIKRAIGDRIGTPEMHAWRGQVSELRSSWDEAASEYREVLALDALGRAYFQCSALTGLVRVHAARAEYAECEALLFQAEDLAMRNEYNDLLAALRLSEGHLAWASKLSGRSNGSDAALGHFRDALVRGLRHNRFVLDEVLGGKQQGSVLRPIIPACLERGAEGQHMLESLREWWSTGTNDLEGDAGPSISPVARGLRLPEAERIVRDREPGSGAVQASVFDQLDQALGG